MFNKLALYAACLLCFYVQLINCTNKNHEILLEGVHSQLEALKYAMDVIIARVEILEAKTEKFFKSSNEDKNAPNNICDNDNQKLLQTFVDNTESIKLSIKDHNINNILADLSEYLKSSVASRSRSPVETTISMDETNIMNALNRQMALERELQSILNSKAKKTADGSKSAFQQEDLRLHDEHLNCLQNCSDPAKTFDSCKAALDANAGNEGAYLIKIENSDFEPFFVYCKKDLMIIQRREGGSENFFRKWQDYKRGFGNVFAEYWLGLDRLHAITSKKPHTLSVVVKDNFGGEIFATYSEFIVGNEEEGYPLKIGTFDGNITDALSYHNNMKFSTYDRDNDDSLTNCARDNKGAWWYKNCYFCNLNGQFASYVDKGTLVWYSATGMQLRQTSYVHMALSPLDQTESSSK